MTRPQEVIGAKQSKVFLIADMADVQISISKITKLDFIKEASEIDLSLIGTVISELGTNIIKYAGRGTIRVNTSKHDTELEIEIWAEDKGPGIADISLAMKDHYSTGNSLGLGLPAVRRMVDDFNIQSDKQHGTIIYARKNIKIGRPSQVISKSSTDYYDKKPPLLQPVPMWDIGFQNRPMMGEVVSGDSITLVEFDSFLLLALVDISGHGQKAHQLSMMLSDYISQVADKDLIRLLTNLHKKLVGTLGASVGLLLVNIETQSFEYVGVGNTYAARCIGKHWRGVSRDGILGQRLPGINIQEGKLSNGDVFGMWTDGISDHVGVSLLKKHGYEAADKIAHQLVYELGKRYDDASCIIFKWLA